MAKRLFYGYSTRETNVKNQEFADIELIKRDLLNTFYTRPGERVMNPNFGFRGWELLYEPFDTATYDSVVSSVQEVIDSDPRVKANNITITKYDQGMQIQIDLLYLPFNVIQTFSLDFDKRTADAF